MRGVEQMNRTPEQRRKISSRMLLLCLSGLLINIAFACLARKMGLPLYLDTIGSALAAALVAISFAHFNVSALQEQEHLARGVASVASDAIDGDRVDEYIRLGRDAAGYSRIAKRFNDLAKSSENVPEHRKSKIIFFRTAKSVPSPDCDQYNNMIS